VRARERRRIVFSIVFSRLLSSALFVFQIDDVEMKFLSANSISEFSHGLGHVWTVPAVQEESDFSAKRSGAAMYTACFRLEDYLGRDAATVAAGPDVIR
jgi:hypothetical protein